MRFSRLTYSLAGVFLCYGAVVFSLGPCLTSMADTFRVPVGKLGLLFTLYAVGLTPSVLVNGYLSEVRGRRPAMLAAILLMAAGSIALALVAAFAGARGFAPALAAMVLLGFGGGGIESITNILIADDNQPAPAFALNVTHAMFAVGAVLSPVAVSLLLRAGLPWHYLFYGNGALLLVLFLILLPQRMPAPAGEAFPLRAAASLLRVPLVWILLLVISLYVGAETGVSAWVSPLLEKVLHTPRQAAGLSVSFLWMAMLVGRLLSGPLSVRFRPPPFLLVLSLGSALCTLAIAFAGSGTMGLLAAAGTGLFMSGIFAMVLVDTSRHFPERLGAVFGIIMTGVGFGSLTIPAVMGWLADHIGLRSAMVLPAGLMAVVAAIYAARLRR